MARTAGRCFKLLVLPPHSPDHNRIERTREELSANVTRNQHRRTTSGLLQNTRDHLKIRNRGTPSPVCGCSLTNPCCIINASHSVGWGYIAFPLLEYLA